MMRHARRATLLSTLLLAAPGCLVSFDGYELDESASAANGGAGAEGGGGGQGGNGAAGSGAVSGSAGSTSGGNAGASGNGGSAGTSSGAQGGMGGSPGGNGGSSGGGTGGAMGGSAGTGAGGSTGATGGAPTGGVGGASGNGGNPAGGSSGSMGMGGASGAGMGGTGGAGTGGTSGAGMGGSSGTAGTMGTGGSAATGGTSMGGSAGTGAAGGTGGSGGATDCPVIAGTTELIRHNLGGGEFFCIDKYEVTNAQYEAYLSLNPSPANQPSLCSWNTNLHPEAGNGCADLEDYKPGPFPDRPITCVDWCDAKAYCEYYGKRLCGAIDGGGLSPNDYDDPSVSQWHAACTINGVRSFTYGNSYESGRCNDLSSTFTGPGNVDDFPLCNGGVQPNNFYCMSGNVHEWEDACSGSGASAQCTIRGGAWLVSGNGASCAGSSRVQRRADSRDQDMGIRCCWSP